MEIDEQWEWGTLCATKNKRHVPGERRDGTCDHGLFRRPLRVKTSYELTKLERKSEDVKKQKKAKRYFVRGGDVSAVALGRASSYNSCIYR